MVKSCVRGNAKEHAFCCDICDGVSTQIFKIKYTTPKDRNGTTAEGRDKETWICPCCVSEFMNSIIKSRMEE